MLQTTKGSLDGRLISHPVSLEKDRVCKDQTPAHAGDPLYHVLGKELAAAKTTLALGE